MGTVTLAVMATNDTVLTCSEVSVQSCRLPTLWLQLLYMEYV